ncbi:Hypothetical_protein [Hexamita inflata]|uniref:Hypothetical_protein n=1 Tax=Hexamita inflata TaxID=28002 RepID=A0ABP1GIF2_9EUKA
MLNLGAGESYGVHESGGERSIFTICSKCLYNSCPRLRRQWLKYYCVPALELQINEQIQFSTLSIYVSLDSIDLGFGLRRTISNLVYHFLYQYDIISLFQYFNQFRIQLFSFARVNLFEANKQQELYGLCTPIISNSRY